VIDPRTLAVADAELGEAMRALLTLPHHPLKVIVTTRVVSEMDWLYLVTWGFHRLVVELHERLRGRIGDASLEQRSVGHMGLGYWRTGDTRKGIACFERATELALRRGERDWAAAGE
jgi:hypothetical protein